MEPLDRFDIVTDTLSTGDRRCDYRYKAIDEYGYSTRARCTRAGTVRIRVTPAEAEAYEAYSCQACFEHAVHVASADRDLAKIEALAG